MLIMLNPSPSTRLLARDCSAPIHTYICYISGQHSASPLAGGIAPMRLLRLSPSAPLSLSLSVLTPRTWLSAAARRAVATRPAGGERAVSRRHVAWQARQTVARGAPRACCSSCRWLRRAASNAAAARHLGGGAASRWHGVALLHSG
jgi:hypothetical protein